jgi:hypothetical protein
MQTSRSSTILRHLFHALVILAMLFSLFRLSVDSTAAADPPFFNVVMGNDPLGQPDIQGYNWPLATLVTMTYQDLTTPATYTRSATMEDHGWGGLQVLFDTTGITVHAGDVVTLTDGVTTLTHTVTALRLTNVDPWLDLITGTAAAGSSIHVSLDGANGRTVTAASNGSWLVDYSHAGVNPGEDIADVTPGQHLMIQQAEGGGYTGISLTISNYTLHVNLKGQEVHGHDWLGWSQANLTIDDDKDPNNGVLYTEIKPVLSDTTCGSPCFNLQGIFTLAVGQYVTMAEGSISKTVQISTLHIDSVNAATGILTGGADPGSSVMVNINSQGGKPRSATADATSGAWSVDFSVAQGENLPATIGPGDNGRAIQLNPDGSDDGTLEYWNVPNPRFTVQPDHGWVQGNEWPVGNMISLTVDDPGNGSCSLPGQTVGGDTTVFFMVEPTCDLHVGETVTMTDGISTKSTVIAEVHFDTIHQATNTASGRAPTGLPANVFVRTATSQAGMDITIGSGDQWTADFSGLLVIDTILDANIQVFDPDGDGTLAHLRIPNFQARMTDNEVHGYNWPMGATVTLTIDDPDGPDYGPVSLSPVVAPWDASQTFTQFTLGTFTLQPGQFISMTDGNMTKTHTVTDLLVTGINAALDTVSGMSTSGNIVEVGSLCDAGGCAVRRVTPSGGAWLADFKAAPGAPTPEEQYPFDIKAGVGSDAVQLDVDGDGTQRGWFVPYIVYLPLVVR